MDNKISKLFGVNKPLIGMIHLAGDSFNRQIKRALYELDIYESEGVNGAIIENYHGSEDVVKETLKVVQRQKREIVLGVNLLPNEFGEAFDFADRFGAKFIQLDHVAGSYYEGRTFDNGLYSKFRESYPNISVLGGVHPKCYTPVPKSNLEKDLRVGMGRADAIVVTGEGTGIETDIRKIKRFRKITGDYSLVDGAGLNPENAYEQMQICDVAIVGTAFKAYTPNRNTPRTRNKVERSRVKELDDIFKEVRKLKTSQ